MIKKCPIVTIGVFDGVHIAHQKIIRELIKRASKTKEASAVITFHPHPLKIIQPKFAPPLLISLEHRLRLLFSLGVANVFVIKFTKSLSRMGASDFVREVLVRQCGVKEIVIGEDFVFGRNQGGNCRLLKKLGTDFNFKVTCIKEININGMPVSSTRIRKLIEMGKLQSAKRLLGRNVTVLGTVIKGRLLGRRIGFPTANINPHHEVIPPSGVYAVRAFLSSKNNFLNADTRGFHADLRGFYRWNYPRPSACNPRKSAFFFNGVLNIGFRPTLGKQIEPSIELHLFNFKKNLYGRDMEVEFIKKIREEKTFRTLQELRTAIIKDVKAAKKILSKIPHPIS